MEKETSNKLVKTLFLKSFCSLMQKAWISLTHLQNPLYQFWFVQPIRMFWSWTSVSHKDGHLYWCVSPRMFCSPKFIHFCNCSSFYQYPPKLLALQRLKTFLRTTVSQELWTMQCFCMCINQVQMNWRCLKLWRSNFRYWQAYRIFWKILRQDSFSCVTSFSIVILSHQIYHFFSKNIVQYTKYVSLRGSFGGQRIDKSRVWFGMHCIQKETGLQGHAGLVF